MKTAVIGSRSFNDFEFLKNMLEQFSITQLVSGGAQGADKLAERYALSKGIPTQIFLPDYKKYPGKIAPLKRNEDIISSADQVIAFWDGKSRGTINAMKLAKKQGKKVSIFRFDLPNKKEETTGNPISLNASFEQSK